MFQVIQSEKVESFSVGLYLLHIPLTKISVQMKSPDKPLSPPASGILTTKQPLEAARPLQAGKDTVLIYLNFVFFLESFNTQIPSIMVDLG